MRVAERAGVTEKLNGVIYRITRVLFKGVDKNSAAMKAISLNITSNMLGLGNAATPFGIKAMKELDHQNGNSKTAGDNMILFAVMNSAAFQLVPSASIAAIRLAAGAAAPLDIMPAVWLTSAVSLTAGIIMAVTIGSITGAKSERKKKR